jgi:hypothetical protein
MRVFVFLTVAVLCAFDARGQQPPGEPAVYNAFIKGGPIVIGKVTKVQPPENNGVGTVTVAVTSQLRGQPIGTELTTQYAAPVRNSKYPPFGWSRIPPENGKNVLLFLNGSGTHWDAIEVLDIDQRDAKWMQPIRAMLTLEGQGSQGEKAPLLDALSNSDPLLKSLASEILLNRLCAADTDCRMQVLRKFIGIASDPRQARIDRTWAVSRIAHGVFAGFSASDPVDKAALNALAAVLTDPDVALRAEAVVNLHGLLAGGVRKPALTVSPAERAKAVEQLRKDAQSNVSFATQARELLGIIGQQQ